MNEIKPTILYCDPAVVVCHKPAGILSEGTGADALPALLTEALRQGGEVSTSLYVVHRLDRETEGLLFVTDDGKWNRLMTLPESGKEKCYEFIVMGELTPEKIQHLEQGVCLNGSSEPTAPAKVTVTGFSTLGEVLPQLHPEIQEKSRHNPMDRVMTFGTITITQGRYRQIRRMMKAVRCLVLELRRISIDHIRLDEELKPGQWKEIYPQEQ